MESCSLLSVNKLAFWDGILYIWYKDKYLKGLIKN